MELERPTETVQYKEKARMVSVEYWGN